MTVPSMSSSQASCVNFKAPQYVAIREEKPKDKEQAKQPEFNTCKDTLTAIIADGEGQGTMQKGLHEPSLPRPSSQGRAAVQDETSRAKWKVEQEKQRRDDAIANTTGLRVLSAIASAVPVRLLKRDLLFIAERLLSLMDENRIEAIGRQHGIRQKRDDGGVRKTLTAFFRRADEGTLSRLLVEASILLAASRGNATAILKDGSYGIQGGHRSYRR